MKPSILFVDDEPNVLSGIKRMLYPKRSVWNMTFCGGGREALQKLDETSYDILVTDLLMPEMDGATLLEAVFTRHHPLFDWCSRGSRKSREFIRCRVTPTSFSPSRCSPNNWPRPSTA